MRNIATALLSGGALLLTGCDSNGSAEEVPQSPEIEPGEAQKQLEPGEPEVVATGLEVPWGLDFLPDGDALVTERDTARVLRVAPDGDTQEVGSIEDVQPGGEGGLLGLAVSPAFNEDAVVYLYYTSDTDNRVVRAAYDEASGLGEPEVVLDGIPKAGNHNGGRIAFGPDGMLYIGTGDAAQEVLAQDTDSLAGKILRVTPEGEPAADNPFGNHVYSYGHRNVQGLAWEGDLLFAAEFGPDADDEVNLIEPGGNYGWPDVTGIAGQEDPIDPVITWEDVSVASPSGAAVAGGSLWVAALRGGRVWRAPLGNGDADTPVGEPEDLYAGEFGRLRSIVPTPEGNVLWLATSNRDGRGDPENDDDRILRVPLG